MARELESKIDENEELHERWTSAKKVVQDRVKAQLQEAADNDSDDSYRSIYSDHPSILEKQKEAELEAQGLSKDQEVKISKEEKAARLQAILAQTKFERERKQKLLAEGGPEPEPENKMKAAFKKRLNQIVNKKLDENENNPPEQTEETEDYQGDEEAEAEAKRLIEEKLQRETD